MRSTTLLFGKMSQHEGFRYSPLTPSRLSINVDVFANAFPVNRYHANLTDAEATEYKYFDLRKSDCVRKCERSLSEDYPHEFPEGTEIGKPLNRLSICQTRTEPLPHSFLLRQHGRERSMVAHKFCIENTPND